MYVFRPSGPNRTWVEVQQHLFPCIGVLGVLIGATDYSEVVDSTNSSSYYNHHMM